MQFDCEMHPREWFVQEGEGKRDPHLSRVCLSLPFKPYINHTCPNINDKGGTDWVQGMFELNGTFT